MDTPTNQAPVSPAQDAVPDFTHPLQSKTLWAGFIVAALPLIPGAGPVAAAWVAANPALFMMGLGYLFSALRLVTHDKVSVK